MTVSQDRDRLVYKLWLDRASARRRTSWRPTAEQVAMAVLFVADGLDVPRRWDRFLPEPSRLALEEIRRTRWEATTADH